MKAIMGLLFALSTTPAFASSQPKELTCTVNYSYMVRINMETNSFQLWEVAVSVGSILTEDTVIKKQFDGKTLNLKLKNSGTMQVTFGDPWRWAEGNWNHSGKMDKLLTDAGEANVNGVAELFECTLE